MRGVYCRGFLWKLSKRRVRIPPDMKTDVKQYEELLDLPLEQLMEQADKIRSENTGDKLEICSILNARCGLCSEDCAFCAQSSSANCEIETYPLKSTSEIIKAAEHAQEIGAESFGIVTSGNRLDQNQVDTITEAIKYINNNLDIEVCGSLGALDFSQLSQLRDAGLTRFHHNLETSQRFYPEIVSTHDYSQRMETIKAAKKVGLQVCSGGILGMGERPEDWVDMAVTLKNLDVNSVPLNILIPIEGTALQDVEPLDSRQALRAIAIFRIILEDKPIKIAAGREQTFSDEQIQPFRAGANGMMIGGYLTVKGGKLQSDYQLIRQIKELWTG